MDLPDSTLNNVRHVHDPFRVNRDSVQIIEVGRTCGQAIAVVAGKTTGSGVGLDRARGVNGAKVGHSRSPQCRGCLCDQLQHPKGYLA